MSDYKPRPGSHAENATAYLFDRGWVAATALADAIECEPASNLHASLSTGVTHGYFLKRTADGVAQYALASSAQVTGNPAEKSIEEPVQRVVKAEPGDAPQTTASPSVFQVASIAEAKPEVAALSGMRIALWSDGQLVIEQGDLVHKFNAVETRQLVHYLERMAEVSA